VDAQETLLRLEKHVSRLVGAVTHLVSVPGTKPGIIEGYASGDNFASPSGDVSRLRRTLRAKSGGKGRTEIEAKAGAICEALERSSGIWTPDRPETVAPMTELDPRDVIGLDELLLFSAAQYAGRERWNTNNSTFHYIPKPFDARQSMSWTHVWSLSQERERLLPSAYVWYGHPDKHGMCSADSNGCAAGNVIEEAILQGFLELVERDSVALWWYNRITRPGVDLDTLRDPYIDRVREFYAANGRELWALDVTADLGIPTFAALSRRIDQSIEDIVLGFGAHMDARTALTRALTELNQMLPNVLQRNSDGTTRYSAKDAVTSDWMRTVRVADQPWLLPDPLRAAVSLGGSIGGNPAWNAGPGTGHSDIADEVRACLEVARRAGLEIIVCNQSRPDIDLAVVKVIVPGMRHFWRRLGPGRLYDVPVVLGWLDKRIPESDLNPIDLVC